MAILIPTVSDGDVAGNLFTGVEIVEAPPGTWSLLADVVGYPDPVVVSTHASLALATTAIRALTDDLAAEGDFNDAVFNNVTVLGTLATALAGERIEIGTEADNRASFFTGHADETAPGVIIADASGDDSFVLIQGPNLGDGAGATAMGAGLDGSYVTTQAEHITFAMPLGAPGDAYVLLEDDDVLVTGAIQLEGKDRVKVGGVDPGKLEFVGEVSGAVGVPAANGCVLYLDDNGAGKTRLRALFASGAAVTIATQP